MCLCACVCETGRLVGCTAELSSVYYRAFLVLITIDEYGSMIRTQHEATFFGVTFASVSHHFYSWLGCVTATYYVPAAVSGCIHHARTCPKSYNKEGLFEEVSTTLADTQGD